MGVGLKSGVGALTREESQGRGRRVKSAKGDKEEEIISFTNHIIGHS